MEYVVISKLEGLQEFENLISVIILFMES